MGYRVINDVQVNISDDELSNYLNIVQDKQKCKIVKADVTVDGEYIDIVVHENSI